jgi:hypothetical protein
MKSLVRNNAIESKIKENDEKEARVLYNKEY